MCLKTSNLKSLCCSSKFFFAHVLFVFVFFCLTSRHTQMAPMTFLDLCSPSRRRKGETREHQKQEKNLFLATRRGKRKEMKGN